ncbi:MAG: DNA primase [Desulfobulbus sp.]|jgi:DNA primase|uniref:DNA primase n=1 Tax=Desulfobulbus sp. TaxID=895 RepID=UPI00284DEB94|nr:DNA primase [Desulfobulbus sp.]MDR2551472.1 DNA primase [Desulfobulbus sp.]
MSVSTSRESIKNTVKAAADIAQVIGEVVELKRSGNRLAGLCPFHNEKTPSFSVNPQGQFFHCFGCGEHGDVFAFVMKYHRMDFPEALKFLAQKYGIELEERQLTEAEKLQLRRREALYEANEAAAVVYQQCLRHPKLGKVARTYLEQRGVPDEVAERYRLGCAPDPEQAGWSWLADQLLTKGLSRETLVLAGLAVGKERGGHYDRFRSRVMFPLADMTGRVVAFGGRMLGDGKPKYLNSPESPIFEKSRLLFGLHPHREAIRRQRRALVVEGNFDLLSLAVHGIDNAVAPLGTALTREHIRALRGYGDEAILLFDADAAGLKAAMRSIPHFLAEQVEGRVALLPAGHDPDSYVRAEGPEAIATLMAAARPLAEFAFDALVRTHGLTLTGKNKIVAELKELIKDSTQPEQRALMVAHFSEKLGMSPGYFQSGPPAAGRSLPPRNETPIAEGLARLPAQERHLVEFVILYPEYFDELLRVGLMDAVREPAARRLVDLMTRMDDTGARQPEQLLAHVADTEDRAYIVQVLTRGLPYEPGQEQAREMCDVLVRWVRSTLHKQASAELQEEIRRAESLGNKGLLMELIGRKQEMEQKKKGYPI